MMVLLTGWLSNGTITTTTTTRSAVRVCVCFVEGDVMKFESFTEIWFRGIEQALVPVVLWDEQVIFRDPK